MDSLREGRGEGGGGVGRRLALAGDGRHTHMQGMMCDQRDKAY